MIHLSEETLNEYLDGVLPPAALAATGAHLQGCPACRAQLEQLRGLFAALESLPEAPLERDLAAAVVTALAARAPLSRGVRLALVVQALGALAVIVLAWPLLNLETVASGAALAWGPALAQLPGWFALQWASGMQAVLQFASLPSLGAPFSLDLDPPAVLIALTLLSASLLWLVGNGLLLRPQAGSYKRRHS